MPKTEQDSNLDRGTLQDGHHETTTDVSFVPLNKDEVLGRMSGAFSAELELLRHDHLLQTDEVLAASDCTYHDHIHSQVESHPGFIIATPHRMMLRYYTDSNRRDKQLFDSQGSWLTSIATGINYRYYRYLPSDLPLSEREVKTSNTIEFQLSTFTSSFGSGPQLKLHQTEGEEVVQLIINGHYVAFCSEDGRNFYKLIQSGLKNNGAVPVS